MKWYTAIGVKKSTRDGRFCVRIMEEEKILTGMETEIWSTLLWAFCEEHEIQSRVESLLRIAFGESAKKLEEAEFLYCLRRLERRGLIAAAEGEYAQAAIERLIGSGNVVCVSYRFIQRIPVFLNSMSMGKGLRFSMRAFKKEILTQQEENLLKILEAEGSIQKHLQHLEDQEKKQEFLKSIYTLYTRKQVLFQNMEKEVLIEKTVSVAG